MTKVHDTQAELLNAIGIDTDLRKVVGENLSEASDKIAGLVKGSEKVDSLEQVDKTMEEIMTEISKITERSTNNRKEK